MDYDAMTQLLMLELRDAIASKEFLVIQANQQLQAGGWLCNWDEPIAGQDFRIEHLRESIRQRIQ